MNHDEVSNLSLKPENTKSPSVEDETQKEVRPRKLVFDDEPEESISKKKDSKDLPEFESNAVKLKSLLDYFMTPPYLRKSTFHDLSQFESARKLPRLPIIGTLHSRSKYTIGIASPGKVEKRKKSSKKNTTKFIDIGAPELLELSQGKVELETRVVVNTELKTLGSAQDLDKTLENDYIGFRTFVIKSLSELLDDSEFMNVWVPCNEFKVSETTSKATTEAINSVITLSHVQGDKDIRLVFGSWKELNWAFEDKETDNTKFFSSRVRIPRSTRVEDAVVIGLAKIEDI